MSEISQGLTGSQINRETAGQVDYGERRQEVEGRRYPIPEPAPQKEKPYEIRIVPLDKGYHVTVGCQSMAIQNQGLLISLLDRYLRNPAETQKRYFDGSLL